VQHKKNPITGDPLTTKQIIRLKMAKNTDDKWHCPVTYKVRIALE
jgi:peptidyl-prolyl cis-trans isomerase-like 2